MTVNVSAVVKGPLSKPFMQRRNETPDWQDDGNYAVSYGEPFRNRGVIYPADDDALKFTPDGTRAHEAIVVMARNDIRFTDYILHHGSTFKVCHAQDYSDYGYYYAVAVLTDEPANPDSAGFANE
jgi:hypothetical protein